MFLNRAATAQSNAGTFNAVAGVPSSFANKTGAWDKLFNETPQSTDPQPTEKPFRGWV